MGVEMIDKIGQCDDVRSIDEAMDAVTQSMTKGITHLPPMLAVNMGIIMRSLKVYRFLAEHESKKKA